jgi:hypothetical protein
MDDCIVIQHFHYNTINVIPHVKKFFIPFLFPRYQEYKIPLLPLRLHESEFLSEKRGSQLFVIPIVRGVEIVLGEKRIEIGPIFTCQLCGLAHVPLAGLQEADQVTPFKGILGILQWF